MIAVAVAVAAVVVVAAVVDDDVVVDIVVVVVVVVVVVDDDDVVAAAAVASASASAFAFASASASASAFASAAVCACALLVEGAFEVVDSDMGGAAVIVRSVPYIEQHTVAVRSSEDLNPLVEGRNCSRWKWNFRALRESAAVVG